MTAEQLLELDRLFFRFCNSEKIPEYLAIRFFLIV
jgi:hypothetical protein